MGMIVGDVGLAPKGFFQVSVNAAQTLAALIGGAGVPAGARFAWINPESGAVRMRDDGAAPTTTVGYLLEQGMHFPCGSVNLGAVQLVGVAGATTVNLLFYG